MLKNSKKITINEVKSKHDFFWSDTKEPHVERRKNILKAHPEIKKLYGFNHKLAYSSIALVIAQLILAVYVSKLPFIYLLIISYIVGATITHALFLAIHEITHFLAFKKRDYNNWLALIANLPIVFPYAMSFRYIMLCITGTRARIRLIRIFLHISKPGFFGQSREKLYGL